MPHDIDIEIPEIQDDRDEILFLPKSLPIDLFTALERFTRIPKGEWILRFVVAYELCPLYGANGKAFLKSFPILFMTGDSGSGKTTLGAILQRLNPQASGDVAGVSAGSNYKGWEQKLKDYRYGLSGKQKSFPLMSIDDLTPECFTGMVGDLRLNFFKQVVSHTGSFTRGGVDGTALTTDAYCKIICSSISDIPTYEGLGELERRIMRIKTKKVEDWTDEDHWGITRDEILEEHTEYVFSDMYDESRHIWFNANAQLFVQTLKKLKALLRGNFKGFIPQNRVEIFGPLIALTAVAFDEQIETCLDAFKTCFLSGEFVQAESNLSRLLRDWLGSPNNVYAKREQALKLYGQAYEIALKEITIFLNVKISERELSKQQCSRESVINVMSSFGFDVTVQDSCTVFVKKGESEDYE